jgi:outer membrane protein assembly factor BamD
MNPKLKSAVLFPLILAAGCSSVSMPSISMPWSGSAVKADPGAEALFEEGTRAFNEKKYVRALDSFSKIRTDHPFSPQVTQAELKIAEAYFFNEQYPGNQRLQRIQTLHDE